MKIMFVAMGSEIVSLEAVSAMLKKHGHECRLAFDRAMFDDKQYFSVPFLARIFDDRKQVVKDIVRYKPDLLAFSAFADNFQWCLDVARRVKTVMDVPVIMGGIHPTTVPEVCIKEDAVDIVCRGEGEYPLLELAQSMGNGWIDYSIPNLWFKKDGEIIKNPPRPSIEDMDELPLLDKELFAEFIPIKDYYLTVTNKGCVASCAYCSENFKIRFDKDNNLGKYFRERSVDSVIAELKTMKKRYGIKRVDIKNNVLSARKTWTLEFTEKYKKEINLPFRIMGHPKLITPDVAKALKESGCWHVQLGIESFNPRIRNDILQRFESNEEILAALQAMEDAGLHYSTDIMVGLPGETDQDIIQALECLADKKRLIRASIFWLQYNSGLDITTYAFNNQFITEKDLDDINNGRQANYLSTGSVRNRATKERLLNFQMLFRLLPILPTGVTRWILRKRYYRIFKYFPQIPVIIAVDILVSIVRKDFWAMYAMYSYLWELNRRAKRRFKSFFESDTDGAGNIKNGRPTGRRMPAEIDTPAMR